MEVPTCRSLGLQASTGRRVDPGLFIAGEGIPLASDSFKFLGMPMRVYSNTTVVKISVKECSKKMLVAVDQALVTRQQKLRLFQARHLPPVVLVHHRYQLTNQEVHS